MDKTTLRILKSQRSKLLNKKCLTHDEFEQVQDKLNELELHIKLIENKIY